MDGGEGVLVHLAVPGEWVLFYSLQGEGWEWWF